MKEKQIVLHNILVNYYEIGSFQNAAETAIFLHGWRSNAQIWLPVVKLLTGRNYQIYSLDLPGFGKSQTPSSAWKTNDYSNVIKEFIEKLGLKKVSLIGHSFGGRVAVRLAVAHPQLIEKLILVSCGGWRPRTYKRRIITTLAKILKPAFALPLLKSLRPAIYYMVGAEDYLSTPELKTTFLNIINENEIAILPKVRHKTLIIWGKNDQETPLEFGKSMHELIPNSSFMIFLKSGHFSFLDEPKEFVEALIKFFEESPKI